MLEVSKKVKDKYKSYDIGGTITIKIGDDVYTDTDLVSDSLKITESICSKDVLDFSCVEANKAVFQLAKESGNIKDLIDKNVYIFQTVEGTEVPLGNYTVYEAELDGDYFTTVTCYDYTKKLIDTDISDWWNAELVFPLTVKDLTIALCKKVGILYELPSFWCNSEVPVSKNAYLDDSKASDILGMIQQVSACFFSMSRTGKLKMVVHDAEVSEIPYTHLMEDATIADYSTPPIQAVQIRQSSDDIGASYGTGNTYVIEDNILFNALTTAELEKACKNIYDILKNVSYVPFSATYKSLPYVECGDYIKITSFKGNTTSFWIFTRELSGNGLVTDTVAVSGKSDKVITTKSSKKSITVLKRKMHEVTNTLDEFRSDFEEVDTKITRVSDQVQTNTSSIKQNADLIATKVSTSTMNEYVDNLQKQIDNNIESWSGKGEPTVSNYPASNWKTDSEKAKHIGDIFYNEKSFCYRFMQSDDGSFHWILLKDTDVTKALADSKEAIEKADNALKTKGRTYYLKPHVFTVGQNVICGTIVVGQNPTYPDTPYKVGDLIVQGINDGVGRIYVCTRSREDWEETNPSDWEPSSSYLTQNETETKIEQTKDSILLSVDSTLKSYATTEQLNTSIELTKESITQSVSKTYVTQKAFSEKTGSIDGSIAATNDKFKNYSTTTEMQSAIKQTADEINLTVSKKVDGDAIIAAINLSTEQATIKAEKIGFVFGETGKQITFKSDNGDGIAMEGNGQIRIKSISKIVISNDNALTAPVAGNLISMGAAVDGSSGIATMSMNNVFINASNGVTLQSGDTYVTTVVSNSRHESKESNGTYSSVTKGANRLEFRVQKDSYSRFWIENFEYNSGNIASDIYATSASDGCTTYWRNFTYNNLSKVANSIVLTSTSNGGNGLRIYNYDSSGNIKGKIWMNQQNLGLQYGNANSNPYMYINGSSIGIVQNGKDPLWTDSEGRLHIYNGASSGYACACVGVEGGDGMHPIGIGWTGSHLVAFVDGVNVGTLI